MTSTPEDAELLKLCEKPLHEMNSHHVLTVQTALKSRLLSPAQEEQCQRDPGCAICAGLAPGALAPPHDASPRCESGKHPHCSCDICF